MKRCNGRKEAITITCEHCKATREARVYGQRFCSDRCRIAHWMAQHPRKGRKPKRIRSRERDRLYTIIHKGETLEQLREQAREAARMQAMRKEA